MTSATVLSSGGYDATVTRLSTSLLGDASFDDHDDRLDFAALASHFGKSSGGTWMEGDFNSDGIVNALDLNAIATNCGAIATVPGASLSETLLPKPSVSSVCRVHRHEFVTPPAQ